MQFNNKLKKVEIESLIFNKQIFNTDSQIENIFNEYFSSVGRNMDESIQICNNVASNPQNLLNSSILNVFCLRPSNSFEVNKIKMSL